MVNSAINVHDVSVNHPLLCVADAASWAQPSGSGVVFVNQMKGGLPTFHGK